DNVDAKRSDGCGLHRDLGAVGLQNWPTYSYSSRWRLGAISRNLAELEDLQGSYLSIHDQPAVPLKVFSHRYNRRYTDLWFLGASINVDKEFELADFLKAQGHLRLIKDQNGHSDLEMGITRRFAGLTTARELQRESHQVVVFEKSHRIGRTWAYDPRVESDLLRLDPNRDIGQGSLYKSMQTNLPRELMSFTDFKFSEKVYDDPRTYPGHEEVLMFLEDFARNFELTKLIQFNTAVTRVEVISSGNSEFEVESETNEVSLVKVFDAVVVCNGHNSQPRLAIDIPDSSRGRKWVGFQFIFDLQTVVAVSDGLKVVPDGLQIVFNYDVNVDICWCRRRNFVLKVHQINSTVNFF
ncbi:flavin-containing monooxygenase FMO GS-OX5-like protein, partial [Tanacetum coccineum]